MVRKPPIITKFGQDQGDDFGTAPRLRTTNTTRIVFNNERIGFVDQVKYLGVMLNGPLNFKAHADYLVRKVTPKLRTLCKIRSYIGSGTALYLYNSLIAPVLSFNDHVYDSMGTVVANSLQVLHNSCLSMCLIYDGLKPRHELYEEAKIPPLYIDGRVNSCGIVY